MAMEGWRRRLTQPGQLAAKLGLLGVDAEPDCASGVPGVDVCTCGYFGKVRLEWTWVVGVGVDADFDAGTSGDSHGGSARF